MSQNAVPLLILVLLTFTTSLACPWPPFPHLQGAYSRCDRLLVALGGGALELLLQEVGGLSFLGANTRGLQAHAS